MFNKDKNTGDLSVIGHTLDISCNHGETQMSYEFMLGWYTISIATSQFTLL